MAAEKLLECPECRALIDSGPIYDTESYRGIIPKGHVVRCESCATIFEIGQWKRIGVIGLSLVPLIPFLWVEESSVFLRLLVSIVVLTLLLGPFVRFFPKLYVLKAVRGDT